MLHEKKMRILEREVNGHRYRIAAQGLAPNCPAESEAMRITRIG